VGAVAADDDGGLGERALEGDEGVEAVDEQRSAAQLGEADAAGPAGGGGRLGAGAAAYGEALARAESVTLADGGGGVGLEIAAPQAKAELGDGEVEPRALIGREEARVGGFTAAPGGHARPLLDGVARSGGKGAP
jgi:hypothetical protein